MENYSTGFEDVQTRDDGSQGGEKLMELKDIDGVDVIGLDDCKLGITFS